MKKSKQTPEELQVVTVKDDLTDLIRQISRKDGRVEKYKAQIRKLKKEVLEIKRSAEAEIAEREGEYEKILTLINRVLDERKDLVELKKKYQAILEGLEA